MQYLFANSIVSMPRPVKTSNPGPADGGPVMPKKSKRFWQTLAEQCVNSLIVGGIAGLAALSASPEASGKTAAIAFGITFLTELRKYRKL